MEILGCGASRAGWSVMPSGYMEWNFWPQFDQKMSTYAWESHMQDWQRIPGGHRTPGVASYSM